MSFVFVPGITIKVFLTDMDNSTLPNAWYEERKDKIPEQNFIVISAAARLLLNKMPCRSLETEFYQKNKEILLGTDLLPLLLKYIVRLLVGSEIKQEVLKSVTLPLLFGLGVKMDHIVGSKTLIIELAKLGFTSAMVKLNDSSNQW